MVVNVDRKSRIINLSIKAREVSEEKSSVAEHKKQTATASAPTTVGDLLKSQLDKE